MTTDNSNLPRSYTCAMCGGTFTADWAEGEALDELRRDFGDVPLEDCDQVCDKCYQQISPRNNPAAYADYLAAVARKSGRFNYLLPTQTMLDDTETLRAYIEAELTEKLAEWFDNELAKDLLDG